MELEKSIKDNKMTVDEVIDIIDTMYQKKMSTTEENNTIYVDKIDDVKFTDLEVASVILLREVKSLRGQVENSIPKKKVEDKIKELEKLICEEEKELEHTPDYYIYKAEIRVLQELLEDK